MMDTNENNPKPLPSASPTARGYAADSGPPTYRIETVADLLTVPAERVDAMLTDLRAYLRMLRPLADHLNAQASAATGGKATELLKAVPAFTWVDDGANDLTIRLRAPSGETHMHTISPQADAA